VGQFRQLLTELLGFSRQVLKLFQHPRRVVPRRYRTFHGHDSPCLIRFTVECRSGYSGYAARATTFRPYTRLMVGEMISQPFGVTQAFVDFGNQ
jgi:hypothetical protein